MRKVLCCHAIPAASQAWGLHHPPLHSLTFWRRLPNPVAFSVQALPVPMPDVWAGGPGAAAGHAARRPHCQPARAGICSRQLLFVWRQRIHICTHQRSVLCWLLLHALSLTRVQEAPELQPDMQRDGLTASLPDLTTAIDSCFLSSGSKSISVHTSALCCAGYCCML